MNRAYLAGPMHGLPDAACVPWRNRAKQLLAVHGIEVHDPMSSDYRGREDDHAEEIVEQDKDAISQCSVLLVNAHLPSWGTAMEVFYAASIGIDVVAFSGAPSVSPWLRHHTTAVFGTLEDAVDGLATGSVKGMR